MIEGNFIRILYSTYDITLNGIYLLIQFNDVVTEKYYNKIKCSFNVHNHKELIEKIKVIEENLLKNNIVYTGGTDENRTTNSEQFDT